MYQESFGSQHQVLLCFVLDTVAGPSGSNGNGASNSKPLELTWYSDDEDDAPPISEGKGKGKGRRRLTQEMEGVPRSFLDFNR